MLEKGRSRVPASGLTKVKIVEPVRIEDGATVTESTIGPNVVIGAGSVVKASTLRDTIVGERAQLDGCTLRDSMIGDRVVAEGLTGAVTLGEDAEVRV
jgi:glucose-1-phosphate thymidylyltransferase